MPSAETVLRSYNVKPTPQRMVITEYLLTCTFHPTADEVFAGVQDMLPVKLSRATVYNTLNALSAAGVICAISLEPGKVRYDANLVEHHHFVDTQTGKIVDIPWDMVSELCQSLGTEYKIRDYHITFYGEHTPEPG